MRNINPMACPHQPPRENARAYAAEARACAFGLVALAALAAAERTNAAEERHALTMHGDPALTAGFTQLPYANPDAPKGGRFTHGVLGTFDSLNPLIIKG